MLIRTDSDGFNHPRGSEITPRPIYEQRRQWLRTVAAGAAGGSNRSSAICTSRCITLAYSAWGASEFRAAGMTTAG